MPHVMENSQQSEDATLVVDSLSTTCCSCESDISVLTPFLPVQQGGGHINSLGFSFLPI